ncbi:RNI-like protein [Tilletiaria anomala UBC 951]|uniref:RNI-like protein n=1 Tax=Tilletiaria anomala (strain ATCC 24038 / CBS 436.72 / UBC 951) TaxID=1037660 RepID=A0A066VZC2_TILAU|nr:RNI-like protein [Tilletiaria anomala UBC 951]KDN46826.1 RNI-like protein [Tilletiaria anomala UBC 951]
MNDNGHATHLSSPDPSPMASRSESPSGAESGMLPIVAHPADAGHAPSRSGSGPSSQQPFHGASASISSSALELAMPPPPLVEASHSHSSGLVPSPQPPTASSSASSSRQDFFPRGSARSSHHLPPSPSNTSQSEDGEDDEDDEDDDDMPSSSYIFANAGADTEAARFLEDKNQLERRNTITARGGGGAAICAGQDVAENGSRASLPPRSIGTPVTPGSVTMSEGEGWGNAGYVQSRGAAHLPHEIMLHIFKYVIAYPGELRNCLQVCKTWCLGGVELLWHRPTFHKASSFYKMTYTLSVPSATFDYAMFIRRLNFSLLGEELDNATFERMAACVRLERLTLAGCRALSDEKLSAVLENTKELVAIDLTDVTQLSDRTINTLAMTCSRLQGINLTGCTLISSASVANLARNCKLLRRIKLCGCKNIADDAIEALALNCPFLLEVDLTVKPTDVSKVTDAGLAKLWEHSTHLREFRLSRVGAHLTDRAFPSPASGQARDKGAHVLSNGVILAPMHNGRRAHTHAGESASSYATAASMAALHRNHNGALDGDDEAHAPLLVGVRPPRMFDHLRILDLMHCSSITDAAIEGVINNAPKLRNLILSKCSSLTDDALYSISRLGKNLHYLHLGRVDQITDQAVIYLAKSCTRLRYVDLAYCPNLTDASVKELALNLPKLRRIGLVKVQRLTDAAIYALVERYTSLERIHLSYCDNISVPAVFWLLQRLDRLTHLSLTGVPAFRREELQAMCRKPPEEFNEHQRSAFCVYSGKGVNQLRGFLRDVYSDQARAEQFGELPPEIVQQLTDMAEQEQRHRQHCSRRSHHPNGHSHGHTGHYAQGHQASVGSGDHHHFQHQQQSHSPAGERSAAELAHLRNQQHFEQLIGSQQHAQGHHLHQYYHYHQGRGNAGSGVPHLRRASDGEQLHMHLHPPAPAHYAAIAREREAGGHAIPGAYIWDSPFGNASASGLGQSASPNANPAAEGNPPSTPNVQQVYHHPQQQQHRHDRQHQLLVTPHQPASEPNTVESGANGGGARVPMDEA